MLGRLKETMSRDAITKEQMADLLAFLLHK